MRGRERERMCGRGREDVCRSKREREREENLFCISGVMVSIEVWTPNESPSAFL